MKSFSILFFVSVLTSWASYLFSKENLLSHTKEKSLTKAGDYLEASEKIQLFDGSRITGRLLKLDKNKNLFWKNDSVSNEISFNYKSVSNILFNRGIPQERKVNRSSRSMRLFLRNGDKLLGKFERLTQSHFFAETEFTNSLKIPIQFIDRIELLPSSYSILYDSSSGLNNWKKSNSKSWDMEESDLVSVFSGSTGTLLPRKDAIEIQFQAEWERSFYLAIRLFSDSNGANYGNVGYHLSFSNNRMNLQINKRVKGRIVRETLGSLMLDNLMDQKRAFIQILAHRIKKQFIISINDKIVAKWKDSSLDFFPKENGILFINQGGNSFIRLKELNLAGWNGSYFPSDEAYKKPAADHHFITLNNGDSTTISSIEGNEESISVSTLRGSFDFPVNRLRSVNFTNHKFKKFPKTEPTCRLSLTQSLGQLSCDLDYIEENKLYAVHPFFGKFNISLDYLKSIKCNLNILKIRKYLDAIQLATEALNNQDPSNTLAILEKQDPSLRSWYWRRLQFLAENMMAEEILSFTPHPGKGLASAHFAGDEKTILTTSKKGSYSLWSGHAELANGTFSSPDRIPIELGRFTNEAQYGVSLNYSFWLSETEVTRIQFEKLTGIKQMPSGNSNLPVICSWFEAQEYCKLLNEKIDKPEGYIWRLPTQTEWEKACRANSTGPYFGTSKETVLKPEVDEYREHLSKYGWFGHNSFGKVQPVKQKLPNSFGFYDMHGNVWEWCLDATMTDKTSLLSKRIPGQINPLSRLGDWRILRGGCFNVEYNRCRTAYIGANAPSVVEGDRGFRVALGPDLNSDLNSTLDKNFSIVMNYPDIGIKLLPVPGGSFTMGSPDTFTMPKAITRSFGDELLTGSAEGILGLTDFSGQPIKQIAELNSSITLVASSANDQLIIVGCENGEIHLFDGNTLSHVKQIKEHSLTITSIAISPLNTEFCSSGLDGKIICHSLLNYAQKWEIHAKDHNVSFDFIEYNKEGNLLISSGIDSTPKLFDSKNGKIIKLKDFPYQNLIKSRFLPQSNSFASITKNGLIVFTESGHGLVYKIIKTGINGVTDFSFSPHGKKIIVQNETGMCSVRKSPNDNAMSIKSISKSITHTPDYFFALARKSKPVSKSLEDFLKIRGIQNKNILNLKGCRTSPDKKLVITSLDGALRLWSRETGLWITTLGDKFVSPFIDCTFSPDGSAIVALLKTNEFLIYSSENDNFINVSGEEKFKDVNKWFSF